MQEMQRVHLACSGGNSDFAAEFLSAYNIPVTTFYFQQPVDTGKDIVHAIYRRLMFCKRNRLTPVVDLAQSIHIPALDKSDVFWNFVYGLRGIDGILSAMKLLKGEQRRCQRRFCLGYTDDSFSEPVFFRQELDGFISDEPRGNLAVCSEHLDLIYIPDKSGRTLAQMSQREVLRWYERNVWKNAPLVQFVFWYSRRYG